MERDLMQNNLYTSSFKIRIAVKFLFVFIIAIFLFSYVNKVLRFKYGDGISVLDTFYSLEENSVDVLVLGSSHAFEDINPAVLYEENGMASFVLAASSQPMWNTYYYLKEGLKTQTPKLIVLECYCTTYSSDYGKASKIIKSTYGLKWSKDKWNDLKVSIPEEDFFSFVPEFVQFHNRYEELSSADFLPYQGRENYYKSWKGHGDNMEVMPFHDPELVEIYQEIPMLDKIEKYYRMIIELAQKEGIPLCIVVSPCPELSLEEQGKLYMAKHIADEYGVKFMDFNYCAEEIGLDYAEDFADSDHLNYKGNEKYSVYLGEYLKSNFEMPDRRNDSRYDSWKMNVNVRNHSLKSYEIKQINDVKIYRSYIEQLMNTGEYYIISTSKKKDSYGEDSVVYKGEDEVYNSKTDGGEYILELTKWNTLYLDGSTSIMLNNKEYSKIENGQNIVVYDAVLERVVDSAGINPDTDELIR